MDQMGLVLLIGGREVVAITDDSAILQASNGARLTYYRHKKRGQPLWNLVESNIGLGEQEA